ncbi:MAG: hypothetical protein AMJ63_14755 [Myxococcales bacterium SG8_38_1]|jgi:F-type H+-transporting ATPase subunit b|nr:MAG: hypothetical protein AMJ63_14755 [Myxococcales bacterium SG8_38_1]
MPARLSTLGSATSAELDWVAPHATNARRWGFVLAVAAIRPQAPTGVYPGPTGNTAAMNVLFTALLSEGSIIDLDGTIWIQLVLFGIAFFILRPLVFRPMIALFEARENAIEGSKLEALRLQDEAAAESEEFDEEMRRLRLQAGEERDRLRAEGKRLEKAVLDRVREETDKQLAAADKQLATEASKLRAEIKASVPVLGKQIASKLLNREVQ